MNHNSRFAVSIHILTLLAGDSAGRLTSDEIACSVNTHPVVIRRTLAELRRHGLVESRSGALGGWRLARPPQTISLREIYGLVGEPELLGMHPHPNDACTIGRQIQPALAPIFQDAQRALESSLGQVTLADVLQRAQSHRQVEQA